MDANGNRFVTNVKELRRRLASARGLTPHDVCVLSCALDFAEAERARRTEMEVRDETKDMCSHYPEGSELRELYQESCEYAKDVLRLKKRNATVAFHAYLAAFNPQRQLKGKTKGKTKGKAKDNGNRDTGNQ